MSFRNDPLSLDVLEKFNTIAESGSDDERWHALGILVHHLDQKVVEVGHDRLPDRGVARLRVFQARDADRTELYFAVTGQGSAFLGLSEDLTQREQLALGEFDPLWDQVGTVIVTDSLRFGGNVLDALIVVHRSRKGLPEEQVMYHANLAYDGQKLLLRPSEDQLGDATGTWLPTKPDRLPSEFLRWPWIFEDDVSPLEKLPKHWLEELEALDQAQHGQVDAVLRTRNYLCIAHADELVFSKIQSKATFKHPIEDWLKAVALHERETDLLVLAAGDDRVLRGKLINKQGEIIDRFSQNCSEVTSVLAFCCQPPPGNENPDFLVIFFDGTIRRLRLLAESHLKNTWRLLWRCLKLDKYARLLSQRDSLLKKVPQLDQRLALMRNVLDHSCIEAKESAADIAILLKDLLAWFRSDEDSEILLPAVERLLKVMPQPLWAEKETPSSSDLFKINALHGLYKDTDHFHFDVQDKVDRYIHSQGLKEEQSMPKELIEIIDGSNLDRSDLWKPARILKGKKSTVQQGNLAMERWANAFWMAETLQLPQLSKVGLVNIIGLRKAGKHGSLVVATRQHIFVHAFNTKMRIEAALAPIELPKADSVQRLARLNNRSMLVAGVSGRLYLYRWHEQAFCDPEIIKHEVPGSAWTLTVCPMDDHIHVIAAYNKGRVSQLVHLHINGDVCKVMAGEKLSLPKIRFLDLALDQRGGFFLAKASTYGSESGVIHLNEEFRFDRDKEPLHELTTGATGICFDSSQHPRHCLVGDRSGFVRCFQIDEQGRWGGSDLCWMYLFRGGVRSICSCKHQNTPHFIVGTEAGELALLRGFDGRRIWKKRLHAPIRAVHNLLDDSTYILVAMNGGWVATFQHLDGSQQDLDRARACINYLEDKSDQAYRKKHIWSNSDNHSLQFLFKRELKKRPYAFILKELTRAEPRARIMRYLAMEETILSLDEVFGEINVLLSFRELYLLCCYLPAGTNPQLFVDVLGTIYLKNVVAGHGINSEGARMAATCVCLQRLGARGLGAEQILRLKVPHTLLEQHDWVRLELARLWLRSVPKERRAKHGLFRELLPSLFDYPISLFGVLAELSRDPQSREDFGVFQRMIAALAKRASLASQDIKALAHLLFSFRKEKSLPSLMYWLCNVTDQYNRSQAGNWMDQRDDALEALRQLHQISHNTLKSKYLLDIVAAALRGLLHADPVPPDHHSLQARHNWWEQFRSRVSLFKADEAPGGEWEHLAMVFKMKTLCNAFLSWEVTYIAGEVRPSLELEDVVQRGYGQVELIINALPDGQGSKQEVDLLFDAAWPGGLRSPGTLQKRKHLAKYPGEFHKYRFSLLGDLEQGQRTVSVRATITAHGQAHTTSWPLDLQRFTTALQEKLAFHTLLPRCFAFALDHLEIPDQAVRMVVLDDEASQRQLARSWCDRYQGLHVDLDHVLSDCGPGRRYAATEREGAFIINRLRLHIDKEIKSHGLPMERTPICFAPLGGFGNRCLGHDYGDLLQHLWSFLTKNDERWRGSRVILVDSTLARFFRKHMTESVSEVGIHRVLQKEWRRSLEGEEGPGKEVYQQVAKTCKGARTVLTKLLFVEFNYDLRLVMNWLGWSQLPAHQKETHRAFLEQVEIRQFLKDEMATLSPEKLLALMLGSVSETQVEFKKLTTKHFAAETLFSHVQKGGAQPKQIVAAGEQLSQRVLNALLSQRRQTLLTLKIQAFGPGISIVKQPNLNRLADSVLGKQRRQVMAELCEAGYADWDGHWGRTRKPYRAVIQDLYEGIKDEADTDASVYQAIMGKDRFPLEQMGLAGLDQKGHLFEGLGQITTEDLERLRELAQLWTKERVPDFPSRLSKALGIKPISELGEVATHLTKLGLPIFHDGFTSAGCFWVWLMPQQELDLDRLVEAASAVLKCWLKAKFVQASDQANPFKAMYPRIIVFGPGADSCPPDYAFRVAYLRQGDFLQSAWEGDLDQKLKRRVKRQLRLEAISPFRFTGPLPPGSPLFKGRNKELDYVKSNIQQLSVLVVGSRRVGKTSFLFQFLHWARQEVDLCPIFVDLQSSKTKLAFERSLASSLDDSLNQHIQKLGLAATLKTQVKQLGAFAQSIIDKRLLPIFIFNEVDGLVKHCSHVIESWRLLNEVGKARFMMVGYATIGQLGDPNSSFYHFTQGTAFDNKAIALTALSPDSANDLLDLLESDDLGLSWNTQAEKQTAYHLCRSRSYCIPWVLQQFCQLILERMQARREDMLSYDVVEDALNRGGDVVWRYITSIDYEKLGFEGKDRKASRPGFKLILYALVRQRYFLPKSAPIGDADLPQRNSLEPDLGFTIDEARQAVGEVMEQILVHKEHQRVKQWFNELELSQALRLLTLTLVLEPDPSDGTRFGFMMHILPLELWYRHKHEDPTLDGLILEEASNLLTSLGGTNGANSL